MTDTHPTLDAALGALGEACQRLDREDLGRRVMAARARLDRPVTVICVVGEFKQGKSSLVNGIVGTPICPVDDDMATSAITVVRHAESPAAIVRIRERGTTTTQPVAIEDLPDYVTELGNPENRKGVERVEVGLPSRVLAGGLTLVDTPGMGGLGAGHAAATLSFLPFADGLIFVSDVSAELSEPELAFLRQAADLCPSILIVQPKTDIVPAWQRIVALNEAHLERLGLDLPICPVSNELRRTVLATKDRELDARTGYPDMLAELDATVVRPAKSRAAARSIEDGRRAIVLLRGALDTRREALHDPEALAGIRARAEEAGAHLTRMKGPGARWSVLLSDRITDLSSEVPFRLHGAMRELTRHVDEQIEQMTKGEQWESLAREIQTAAATAVTEAFVAAETGRARFREEIAELIAAEDVGARAGAGPSPIDVSAIWRGKALDGERGGKRAFTKSIVGLRGAQSGMMLFGMTGQFMPGAAAAFMATNPVLLTAGALFGGLQLIEDRKRKVAQRRQAARSQMRTFVDDLQFEVGQELTNLLRSVQRDVRDEFSELITELSRTWTDALRRAEEDAQRTERERGERDTGVQRDLMLLGAIEAVLDRADTDPDAEDDATEVEAPAPAHGGGERPVTTSVDAVAAVQRLCDDAARLSAGGPLSDRADALRGRMAGPLRVAIAGRVKAGKSTLLNALVGERLAATDAGECTKVATAYVHGQAYGVSARLVDGSEVPLSFRRVEGQLRIDLGGRTDDDIAEVIVTWPSRALAEMTLIDTPGLASLNESTSRRTQEFLDPDDRGSSGADAVVYLMRHLHRVDAEFLGAFMDRRVTGASPVNAIAVLSRADEVGACRPDALESADRIAARYRGDAAVRSLVSTVTPMAGLLAETGQTLREDEVAALRAIAGLADDERATLLRSVDDVCELSATSLTVETRRDLLDRFGLYGLRFAVDELRSGRCATASDLARSLVERSGLGALRRIVTEQFAPRARLLQARSALTGLRALARDLGAHDAAAADRLRRSIDEVEAASGDFGRLAAAHAVMSGAVTLPERDRSEAELLLLAGDPVRVASAGGQDGVLAGIERWRGRAADPSATSLAVAVSESVARVFEQAYAPED